jgi:hypothetical protein
LGEKSVRIFIVKSDTDIAALRSKLIRADGNPAAAKRAEALLAAANAHLEAGPVAAGTVLVVPDAPEFDTESSDSTLAPLLDALDQRIAEGLTALRARFNAGARAKEGQRDSLLKAFKSRGVKAAIDEDESVRREVEQLNELLTQESKNAAKQTALRDAALDRVSTDLKALRARLG